MLSNPFPSFCHVWWHVTLFIYALCILLSCSGYMGTNVLASDDLNLWILEAMSFTSMRYQMCGNQYVPNSRPSPSSDNEWKGTKSGAICVFEPETDSSVDFVYVFPICFQSHYLFFVPGLSLVLKAFTWYSRQHVYHGYHIWMNCFMTGDGYR